ncbi:MAG: ECF transporter S component [Oscillospiraceae bacterium]
MQKKYSWKLRDIIMVALLAVVFGVVYLAAVYLASFLGTLLTPAGLAPLANEFIFGVWFMAATLAACILQKPGAAIIAEVLAALLEVLMGNMYGPIVIVSGIVQGLGAEAVFAATRYRKFNMGTMCLAAAGCCVTSFIWGFFRSGFLALSPWLLLAMFGIRLVSSVLFSGVLCRLLASSLAKTGLLKSYALGQENT